MCPSPRIFSITAGVRLREVGRSLVNGVPDRHQPSVGGRQIGRFAAEATEREHLLHRNEAGGPRSSLDCAGKSWKVNRHISRFRVAYQAEEHLRLSLTDRERHPQPETVMINHVSLRRNTSGETHGAQKKKRLEMLSTYSTATNPSCFMTRNFAKDHAVTRLHQTT